VGERSAPVIWPSPRRHRRLLRADNLPVCGDGQVFAAIRAARVRASCRRPPITPRSVSRARAHAGATRWRARRCNKSPSRQKKSCIARLICLCADRPISHVPVAACRLVGIRTRGRTAARSRRRENSSRVFSTESSEPLNRQPEAKPAHPALNGGRGLKQRRSGLLWSRRPSKGRHRRGLSILAGRAERVFPLQAKAASSGVEPVA
jgi:hypothetical protein